MTQALLLRKSIHNILLHKEHYKGLRYIAFYFLGIAALTLSSKIAILLQPVPITLQTFAVLLIGMIYGSRFGTLTVSSFLLLGLAGVPVFANTPSTLSFGFLFGFMPAAFISGALIEQGWGRYYLTTALAAILGMLVIYSCGIVYLSLFMNWQQAIAVGLSPFVLVCLLKIAALTFVVPQFWKNVK